LDKNEVFLGVDQYCEAREIVFDSRVITQLWSQVDDNGDGVLDRHEFAVFLARYCESVGVGLDDMAFVVLEQLAGVAMDDSQHELIPEEPTSAWAKLTSLTRKKPRKRQSWAQLKVESEKVEETARDMAQSNWDTMKFKIAFNKFKAEDGDDAIKKHDAAGNLWQKVDRAVVSRDKTLKDASDLNNGANDDKNKLLTKAERRKSREQKKRSSVKIQASSLDGFFSSVGDVIEQNKRDRSANGMQGTSSTDDAEYDLSPKDSVP
jgi:chemotaxis protein histidine kinase CheA